MALLMAVVTLAAMGASPRSGSARYLGVLATGLFTGVLLEASRTIFDDSTFRPLGALLKGVAVVVIAGLLEWLWGEEEERGSDDREAPLTG